MAMAKAGATAPDVGRKEQESLRAREETSGEKATGAVGTSGMGNPALFFARVADPMGGVASENERTGGTFRTGSGV